MIETQGTKQALVTISTLSHTPRAVPSVTPLVSLWHTAPRAPSHTCSTACIVPLHTSHPANALMQHLFPLVPSLMLERIVHHEKLLFGRICVLQGDWIGTQGALERSPTIRDARGDRWVMRGMPMRRTDIEYLSAFPQINFSRILNSQKDNYRSDEMVLTKWY